MSTEYAILLPVLLLVLTLIVQAAIYAHARNVAQAAAEEALRATDTYAGTSTAGQQAGDALISSAGGNWLSQTTVSTTRDTTTGTASVTGEPLRILPLPLTIHITVSGPVERFVPANSP